jgi:RNA polymerase sigma factor (TIGR02999 family)
MTYDQDITQMLLCLNDESPQSTEALYAAVYEQLKKIAKNLKVGERHNHTLCTNALVHEAYFQLSSQEHTHWKNRGHFFAIAAMTMRRVLINYARDRKAAKRGSGISPEPLKEANCIAPGLDLDQVLEIDQFLTQMEAFDPLVVRIVECRYFTGLTIDETADALNISASSVKRHWQLGKAWISNQTRQSSPGNPQNPS